jgi:putative copper resistance protein D
MEIDVPLILVRWLHFVSLMIVFGASLFHFYAVPHALQGASLRDFAATDRTVKLASYVALLSGLAWVARSLVAMAGGPGGLLDRGIIEGFFLETSFGPVWVIRIALLLAACVLAGTIPSGRAAKARRGLLAGLAGATLVSQASIGHAAMATGTELVAQLASYTAHVLAAGAWIGGLLPLGRLLAGGRASPSGDGSGLDGCHAVLLRFSNFGIMLVFLILASGVANSAFRLRFAHDLVATAYGWTILAKALLFALMLIAAAINRWRLMPRLDEHAREAMDAIRRNILFEQMLAALVLGAAALLGTLPPQD